MDKIELLATKRTVQGKKNRLLRAEGKIPAIVYGRGVKSEPLEVDAKQAERIYRHAGVNKLVSLKIGDGRPRNVLFHEVQVGHAKGELLHVDFYIINMKEALRAEIPLHFVGESTAVYQDEGTLVRGYEAVEVECLPSDLPESLEVDITSLDDFEKSITLADLTLPANVKLVEEDLTMLVAKVEPPRTDEEMAELDAEVEENLPADAVEDQTAIKEGNDGKADQ